MKQLKIFLMIAFLAIVGFSCEDDKEKVVLKTTDSEPASIVAPANGSSYVLKLADGASFFEAFTWTEANYGADLPRDYQLLMGLTNDFEDATEIIITSELTYELTVADLNMLLYDAGVHEGANDVYFKVITTVKNPAVDTLISDVNKVSITVFPYDKPNLLSPSDGSRIVLKKENADNPFETFSWGEVEYGGEFAVEYAIEFDAENNNFTNASELASVTTTSYTGTVNDINKALIKAGFAADALAKVEFRVVASIEGKKGFVSGDAIKMSITTFSDEGGEVIPPLYLVGAATLAGWDANKGIEISWDKNNSNYSVVTEFVAGGMKILKESGKWAPQWGDDGTASGKLSYRPDEATTDPPEIPSPGVGTFKLTVDIENLTYSFEAQ